LEEGVKELLKAYSYKAFVVCPKHGDKSMVEVIEKNG